MRRYRFQYYLCNWLRWGNFFIKKLFKLGYPEFFFTNKTSTRISDIKFQRCQHQGIELYLFAYKRLRFAKNSFIFIKPVSWLLDCFIFSRIFPKASSTPSGITRPTSIFSWSVQILIDGILLKSRKKFWRTVKTVKYCRWWT